jgi:hypothetical protein
MTWQILENVFLGKFLKTLMAPFNLTSTTQDQPVKKSDSNIEIDHIFLVNHTLCPDLPERSKYFSLVPLTKQYENMIDGR